MPTSRAFARIVLIAGLAASPFAAGAARADSCFDQVVRPLIANVLQVKTKRVDRGASLRGLGAGRRDIEELADRLEDELGVRVSRSEARYWETVEDVEQTACSRGRY